MKNRFRSRLSVQTLESREVPAVISGSVYEDTNHNGLRDPAESGIANVTIKLVKVCGCTRTTTTDANGDYSFSNLLPGAYQVIEYQPGTHDDGLDSQRGVPIPGSNTTDTMWVNLCTCDSPGNDFGELPREKTGQQGLTPGYWKNNATNWGASAWSGYSPTQTVSSVFGSAFGDLGSLTLVQALGANGSGLNALLRHSVAAVLNASSTYVDYPQTTGEILAGVQAAVAGGDTAINQLKNQFDTYNNYGANLDQHANRK